jgi:hypothetical protein
VAVAAPQSLMRGYQKVAIGWSGINVFLVGCMPTPRAFPWLACVLFASVPLLLLFLAKPIAACLKHGFMERFASDRARPQSPLVIMFLAWIVLVLETGFLLAQLAGIS